MIDIAKMLKRFCLSENTAANTVGIKTIIIESMEDVHVDFLVIIKISTAALIDRKIPNGITLVTC